MSQVKSVVLLSSGLDSTVNLYEARQASIVVLALTFDYGQRAASREIEKSQDLCAQLQIPHQVVSLPWFKDFTRTSLVNPEVEIPTGAHLAIENHEQSLQSAKAVWVPNRNGIFLNIAAAFAEGLGADWIVPGFNAEEATTFPDNSGEFLEAATQSFWYSTANHVQAKCFTTKMEKPAIAKRALELGADLKAMWPCYLGGAEPCGECESCLRFRRATQSVMGGAW